MTADENRPPGTAGNRGSVAAFVAATQRIRAQMERIPVSVRTVVAVSLFVLTVSVLGLRVAENLRTPEKRSPEDWGLMDFQSATYYPVVAVLHGINPYDPSDYRPAYPVNADFSPYSPATLLVHLPFGLLPLRTANIAFFAYNTLLLLVLAGVVLWVIDIEIRVWRVFALASLLLLARPVHLVMLGGQIAYEVTIGAVIALHLAHRRPWLAGMGVALASLKPTFGLPLAILMLFRRDWQSVIIGVIGAAISASIGALIVAANTGGLPFFIRVLWVRYVQSGTVPGVPEVTAPLRVDALSVVARLTGYNPGLVGEFFVFVAVIAVAGAALWRLTHCCPHDGAAGLSGAIVSLAIMASVYHMLYDAVLLTVPFAAVLTTRSCAWSKVTLLGRLALAAVLGVVIFNYLLTNTAARLLGFHGSAMVGVNSSTGMAVLTALTMCLYWTFLHRVTEAGRPA